MSKRKIISESSVSANLGQFYKSEFKVSLSISLFLDEFHLASGRFRWRISNNLLTLMLFSRTEAWKEEKSWRVTRSSREIYNFRFLREKVFSLPAR